MTVLEANGEVDAGDVWATRKFPTRDGRQEQPVPPRGPPRRDRGARRGDRQDRRRRRVPTPERLPVDPSATGRAAPSDDPAGRPRDRLELGLAPTTVIRKHPRRRGPPGRARHHRGDRVPSLRRPPRATLRGVPGEIVAQRNGAICRATVDGAVWITHLKRRRARLQAPRHARARARRHRRSTCRRSAVPIARTPSPSTRTARSPTRSTRGVGYLHFDFYNGAMSTDQCRRLLEAYRSRARAATTSVIVLMGGERLLLERHPPQRDRGRRRPGGGVVANLSAIDDVVREIDRDRLAPRGLRAHRRRRGGRRAVRARGRPRRRARGRRAQPLLPAHGRPLRLRVLDLPAAAARRRRA